MSLPNGGGAIKGIGEKFGVNPVNGTGTLSVPVFTTPGRSKFTPNLSLSYNSGVGNGPFGFGWRLSVPNITRKTDKGLPRYLDAEESDVFILSEAEDLVPALLSEGDKWKKDTFTATRHGEVFTVQRYRPRIEGLFARIERWRHEVTGEVFWRSISKDNVTSLYGIDSCSRVADPADPSRVFTWLLVQTYDDRGNVALYEYKPEDGANVPRSFHEQNRQIAANRYLKRINYGNRAPYDPSGGSTLPTDWCFEVVFDYGEHDLANPRPTEDGSWRCRADSFSRYRSTFKVRTYRICSRVLMFHHPRFEPAELVAMKPSLADLSGGGGQQLMDLAGDGHLCLVQFTHPVSGYYEHDADGQWQTFTPFASCPNIDWQNLNQRAVDLDGDGFADILITESEVFTWYPSLAKAGFGPAQTVRKPFDENRGPALIFADGTQSIYLTDASGDGLKDLVRIRNGEICYWPNLGYGRFGAKITMENSPLFDSPDLFDQKRVRPADIDGTGTMDIIYLGSDKAPCGLINRAMRSVRRRKSRSFRRLMTLIQLASWTCWAAVPPAWSGRHHCRAIRTGPYAT